MHSKNPQDLSVLDRLMDYEDYREFLKDYFAEQKSLRRNFTHRAFSEKAGFSNPSYTHYVIQGRYNLTDKNIPGMVRALGLVGEEVHFFNALVERSRKPQSSDFAKWTAKIETLRSQREAYQLRREHYRFFDEWYFPVLKTLVVHANWEGSFEKLAAMLDPPISVSQAKRGVSLLEELQLVRKERNGSYSSLQKNIQTKDVPPEIMQQHRRELLQKVVDSADVLGPEDRFINYAVIGSNRKVYETITQRLRELQNEIMEMVLNDDQGVDEVYLVNLNAVPLSKKIETKGGDDE
jgi:uncharacterized protein (TIGR02147 family)